MKKFRIEVGPKTLFGDVLGKAVLSEIQEDLKIKGLKQVTVIDVFKINAGLSDEQVSGLCKKLFVDPITQVFSVNQPLFEKFDFALEVGLHENVTDNVGITAKRGIEDFLGRKLKDFETVRSRKMYLFSGDLTQEQVQEIAKKQLFNPLIEEIKISEG